MLRITQNRIREKRAIQSIGIPVAPFRVIDSLDDLEQAVEDLGLPAVLKTATGGYDGKGQWVLRKQTEISDAYSSLSQAGVELIVEKFIPFQRELSVVAARSLSGQLA
ncbi:ATP-grasp domain-containing protein, partial [Microbacteriaceae bacterium K1510]|nr:ATP-grasp domain-containing protein [Microbacteriaceae bacterium K1510]